MSCPHLFSLFVKNVFFCIYKYHYTYTAQKYLYLDVLDVEEVLGLRGDGHAPSQLPPSPY